MFYYSAGRLILPSLIQCILNSSLQNGLHHGDICMRNCSKAKCDAVDLGSFLLNHQDTCPVGRLLLKHAAQREPQEKHDLSISLQAAPFDVCENRELLTCRPAGWWCNHNVGSAGKTRWLQSAASRLPLGPDPGQLIPSCERKQTENELSKQAAAASPRITTATCWPAAWRERYDSLTATNTHVSGC